MGYCTDYTLSVDGYDMARYKTCIMSNETIARIEEEIKKWTFFSDGDVNDGYWFFGKWYGWENDMISLSENCPNVLFKLHGEGEDAEDLWDAYFLNGKIQYCRAKIQYEPFDIVKLTRLDA